jgi:hypothetical protein
LVVEEAHGLPGAVLNVLMNCGHSEETDRSVWMVILRCGPLFLDAPSMVGLYPKRNGSGILGAIPADDLIKCKEARKSAG